MTNIPLGGGLEGGSEGGSVGRGSVDEQRPIIK